MTRASRPCPNPGCWRLTQGGRCSNCRAEAEASRGSASARGYDEEHRTRFRAGVLERDPICVLCIAEGERELATVADHWPKSRRELVELGLDPNDPQYGRGLCVSHHGRETAVHQPGGWAAR